MATISLDIPAGTQTTRVLNAVCSRHGYNPLTDGTQGAFCKEFIRRMLVNEVFVYERDTATAVAAAAIVTSDITIT